MGPGKGCSRSLQLICEFGFDGPYNESLKAQADVRPAPRPNKPKPPTKPRLYPVVRAMYDYDAQDTDELSFSVNDEIEVMQKRKFSSCPDNSSRSFPHSFPSY
ncbi:unnamed protein product [Haemonchus placei]|uniref:SH3 domain-containing protein n=1 Tax=Haemonchus placei TaxID=6290 RepID=A0A0N4WMB8_HAEPC|nr:unnamed protein product [Haemonchus placei]